MQSTFHLTDFQRLKFMEAIVPVAQDLALDEFETRFITSFRHQSRGGCSWFTPGRSRSVDLIWNKFGHDIGHPIPLAPTSPAPVTAADPTGCEYKVTDEATRRLRACNELATLQRNNGFRYCDVHAQVARKATNGKLTLHPLGHRVTPTMNRLPAAPAGQSAAGGPPADWKVELEKLRAALALPENLEARSKNTP